MYIPSINYLTLEKFIITVTVLNYAFMLPVPPQLFLTILLRLSFRRKYILRLLTPLRDLDFFGLRVLHLLTAALEHIEALLLLLILLCVFLAIWLRHLLLIFNLIYNLKT